MLDINKAKKTLNTVASNILGKDIDFRLTVSADKKIEAVSKELSSYIGIPFMKSLVLSTFGNAIYSEEKQSYYFDIHYRYENLSGHKNGSECFSARINLDGSLQSICPIGSDKELAVGDKGFNKFLMSPYLLKKINADLVSAAERGRFNVLSKLLSDGADIEAKDEDGNTALLKVSQKIVDKLPDFNKAWFTMEMTNNTLETGLFYQLKNGRIETQQDIPNVSLYDSPRIIQLLLEQGADYELLNNDGRTALDVAKELDKQVAIEAIDFFKTAKNEQDRLNKIIKSRADNKVEFIF